MSKEEGSKKYSKKDWIIAITILLTVLVSIGGLLFYKFGASHNPIPAQIRENVQFTPYYPAELPTNWYIDTKSIINDEQALMYPVKDRNDASVQLSISIQPRSGDFDYVEFYQKSLKGSTQFATPTGGMAVVGMGAGKPLGSLLTDNTWVLVSGVSPDVKQADIRYILLGLKH